MINSFDNYLKSGKVRRKTSDPEESNSLFKKAQKRILFIKKLEINKEDKDFLFEEAYGALREAA